MRLSLFDLGNGSRLLSCMFRVFSTSRISVISVIRRCGEDDEAECEGI